MNEPLVSIIIPVYNSEKYLLPCISSCTEQSYKNLEIVLVDDGSSDNSLKICQSFASKDYRIKVIHQVNAGVSAARNTGLRSYSGEYVIFLDSDDELYLNTVEILLKTAEEHNADIVSGAHSKVDVQGHEHCCDNDGKITVYEGDDPLILSLKYDRRTSSVWAKLFSKKIIDKVFFVEGHNINEDGYFVFECCEKNPRLVQLNKCIYKYYIRDGSSTRGVFSEKYFDMIYFSNLKMKYVLENHPSLIELAKDMEVSTNLFLLEVLCRDYDGKYKSETKKSIRIVRRRYFKYKPINKHEKKMATIVAFGLYPLYKRIFMAKFQK